MPKFKITHIAITLFILAAFAYGYVYLTEETTVQDQVKEVKSVTDLIKVDLDNGNGWIIYTQDNHTIQVIGKFPELKGDSYNIELINDDGYGVTFDKNNTLIKSGSIRDDIIFTPNEKGELLVWSTHPTRIIHESRTLTLKLINLEDNKKSEEFLIELR